jgi:hypothetical protein
MWCVPYHSSVVNGLMFSYLVVEKSYRSAKPLKLFRILHICSSSAFSLDIRRKVNMLRLEALTSKGLRCHCITFPVAL